MQQLLCKYQENVESNKYEWNELVYTNCLLKLVSMTNVIDFRIV